jgi:hypothetical protein
VKTTVICAVWSGDRDRVQLLHGHEVNLDDQSTQVERVYIFDDSDAVGHEGQAFIKGRTVTVDDPLTIYQAWNVALSLVETPYVMNLNLDDRLAPDAIKLLEDTVEAEDVALVGGDWKVCYSQADTDAVVPCYPSDTLPFEEPWPPKHGSVTRLGTDRRGTFGPATMWRMDNHILIPRYPYRFKDGTLITSIADAIWWNLISTHLRRPLFKLPTIIGNYHSHPATQAEFRPHEEEMKIRTTAVSLI